MSEKRFTGEMVGKYFKVCDNKEEMLYSEVVDLLNEQHEEIIELREAMKRLMADMMTGGRPL